MQAPYQIKRTVAPQGGYTFQLIDTRNGNVMRQAYDTAIIAPEWLRMLQARMNTQAVLDKVL